MYSVSSIGGWNTDEKGALLRQRPVRMFSSKGTYPILPRSQPPFKGEPLVALARAKLNRFRLFLQTASLNFQFVSEFVSLHITFVRVGRDTTADAREEFSQSWQNRDQPNQIFNILQQAKKIQKTPLVETVAAIIYIFILFCITEEDSKITLEQFFQLK